EARAGKLSPDGHFLRRSLFSLATQTITLRAFCRGKFHARGHARASDRSSRYSAGNECLVCHHPHALSGWRRRNRWPISPAWYGVVPVAGHSMRRLLSFILSADSSPSRLVLG